MTPEARRHYLELLSDFNVSDVGDDELEQFLSPNMLRALGGFGLQLARIAQSLVRERARVAELEAELAERAKHMAIGLDRLDSGTTTPEPPKAPPPRTGWADIDRALDALDED